MEHTEKLEVIEAYWKRYAGDVLAFLDRRSPSFQLSLGLLLTLVVGFIDYVTGSEIAFSIFYLFPICLATWVAGKRAGILVAVASAFVWLLAEMVWASHYSHPVISYWNGIVRLGMFLIVVFLLAEIRALTQHLEERIAERTNALSEEIAEHRRAEIRLTEAEEKYRMLFEDLNEIVFFSTPEGKVLDMNPAGVEYLGYSSKEELLAINIPRDLYADPSDRDYFHKLMIQQGFVKDLELELKRKDGGKIHVVVSASPLRDEEGRIVSYRGIARDNTEKRLADAKLHLLANALESSADMISITDLDNRFVFVNRTFVESYGYSQDEILGKRPSVILPHMSDPSIEKRVFAATCRDGWRGELINRRKDGSEFPISLSTSQVRDDRGKIIGLIGVARDISEHKRAERALLEATDRFENLFGRGAGPLRSRSSPERCMSQNPPSVIDDLAAKITGLAEKMQGSLENTLSFASLASHELRTPLTIMRQELEDALRAKTSAKTLEKTLMSTYDEILRLNRIVDDFLCLSTMRAGMFKLRKERIDFQKFMRSFYNETLLLSREKNISIVLNHGPGVFIDLDVERFRQVLFNLFDNAVKHCCPKDRIRISHSVENQELLIHFADTGEGIPPEELPHVFDPFFKGTHGASNSSGAGLGLALVRSIVDAHNGKIDVESKPGNGAMFIIRLPLHSTSQTAE